jgi:hypothetical protein
MMTLALPKSAKLNAHLERSHRTHNEKFYEVQAEADQLPVLTRQLLGALGEKLRLHPPDETSGIHYPLEAHPTKGTLSPIYLANPRH